MGFRTAERYIYTPLYSPNPIGGLGVTFLRKYELDRSFSNQAYKSLYQLLV